MIIYKNQKALIFYFPVLFSIEEHIFSVFTIALFDWKKVSENYIFLIYFDSTWLCINVYDFISGFS